MKFSVQKSLAASAFALSLVCVGGLSRLSGQEGTDSIEVRELRAALELSQQENAALREQAERSEAQRKALVESLAEAVRISEEQVASARETQLKLQALGVDLFSRDEQSLEQRLLKSVRDLDIGQQELERRTKQLHALSEAFLRYVQATPNAAEGDRASAMAAIDQAGDAMEELASADGGARELSDSQIVSVDREIGLIVFDAGKDTGIRVGTPIAVVREGRPIFSALTVDVRDSISGAVLQERLADSDNAAVGDGVELLPNLPAL